MEHILKAKVFLFRFIFEKPLSCVYTGVREFKCLQPEGIHLSRVALFNGRHNKLLKCYLIP